ncbi:MAG: extracellular solute-binding protein [Clostridiales bacterium]|nr:extracellular solute-binding protein [Clostridiales bacterium]
MKRTLALIMALIMVVALAACKKPEPDNKPDDQQPSNELAGTYDIKVWCGEDIVELTKQQIAKFNEENKDAGIVINADVQGVSESTAANDMITDIEAGADIFCFPQDQFARLVQAGALSELGAGASEFVKTNNAEDSVAAATAGEKIYAYPLTADNGYFMYYDKSVIPETDIDSLEALIKDCEDNGRYFAMETNTSAWYIAAFFFATGCKSEWVTNDDGEFESVNDTFDSPEGLIAAKGLKKLQDSPAHISSSAADEFGKSAAVLVSGTWAYNNVLSILGENMGVADLPSFEVDGQQYHLGSFSGYKLMGVKPCSDAKRAAVLNKLAQYLTGETCQNERFAAVSWGPSNKAAQGSDAVKANPALVALNQQAAYATIQGQIHGSWWDIAKVIGDDVKDATDEAGLQAALTNYHNKMNELFNMTDDQKNAWSVIGTCNSVDGFFYTDYTDETRSNWAEDIPMQEVSDGIWRTVQAWAMEAGCEFKCRKGGSWDEAIPADNFKVEEAGTYYVELDVNAGTITLVPAE